MKISLNWYQNQILKFPQLLLNINGFKMMNRSHHRLSLQMSSTWQCLALSRRFTLRVKSVARWNTVSDKTSAWNAKINGSQVSKLAMKNSRDQQRSISNAQGAWRCSTRLPMTNVCFVHTRKIRKSFYLNGSEFLRQANLNFMNRHTFKI